MTASTFSYDDCIAAGCEQDSILLGATGICTQNNDTSSWDCVCPHGWSGKDDWKVYQDCHVNEQVQYFFWVFTLATAALMLAISVCALFYLLLFWEYIPTLPRSISKSSGLTNFSESDNVVQVVSSTDPQQQGGFSIDQQIKTGVADMPSPTQQARLRKQNQRMKERQCFTLISLTLLITFSGTTLGYYYPYLKGQYRFESLWYIDLFTALSSSSVFCSMWFFFFVWYDNLPSFQQHGKLFGIDSILIRKPLLIRRSVQIRIVLINFINILLLVIWPQLIDTSTETRDILDTAALGFWAFLALDFNIFLFSITIILSNLFEQLRSFSANASSVLEGDQLDAVNQALYTIKLLRNWILFLGPGNIALFASCAFVPEVRRRTYIAVNLVVVGGVLSGLAITFLFVKRLRGKKKCSQASISDASNISVHTSERV